MPHHPNRSGSGPSRNPSPEQIRAARSAAGLTQTAAAALVHSGLRRWQDWEAGAARMHPGLWALFLLRTHVAPPA
jgi:DNA-binding transcriptional regulator YiaG